VGKVAVEETEAGQRKVTVEKGESAAKQLPRMSANVSTSILRQRGNHNASRIMMRLAFKIYRMSGKESQKVAGVAAAMCLALTLSMTQSLSREKVIEERAYFSPFIPTSPTRSLVSNVSNLASSHLKELTERKEKSIISM